MLRNGFAGSQSTLDAVVRAVTVRMHGALKQIRSATRQNELAYRCGAYLFQVRTHDQAPFFRDFEVGKPSRGCRVVPERRVLQGVRSRRGGDRAPDPTGRFDLDFSDDRFLLRWSTTYQDEQAMVAVEDIGTVYDRRAIEGEVFFHGLSMACDWNEEIQVYGGVQNVTDEEPFFTERAWPVGPLGRYFFVGLSRQR
jgi:outer membrane receptor protein involved in Fe transport